MLAEFGTLAEFGKVAKYSFGWLIVELGSLINIPQWHLTKVHSRRIGKKKQIKLTKAGTITVCCTDNQNHAGLTLQSLRALIGPL